MALRRNWLEWLWPQERRASARAPSLPLQAFYWDGAAPTPRAIRDISVDGMYLITEQRWYPNTLVALTVTRKDQQPDDPLHSIRVTGRVVRLGFDGVGFAFMYPPQKRRHGGTAMQTVDRKAMVEFLDSVRGSERYSIPASVRLWFPAAAAA